MLRYLADENFNQKIVRGLIRRWPEIDIVIAQDIGLGGTPDANVLEWAAVRHQSHLIRQGDRCDHEVDGTDRSATCCQMLPRPAALLGCPVIESQGRILLSQPAHQRQIGGAIRRRAVQRPVNEFGQHDGTEVDAPRRSRGQSCGDL